MIDDGHHLNYLYINDETDTSDTADTEETADSKETSDTQNQTVDSSASRRKRPRLRPWLKVNKIFTV